MWYVRKGGATMNTSVLGKDRIVTLDIIRGMAILGIFLVNMPSFSGSHLQTYEGVDKITRMLFDMFVQKKFYTIFSFLFGLGFYIFMKRAESKGENVSLLFSRRLLILLVFGILHLVFLWHGDILHIYALIGFFLLAFYRRNAKTVLIWGITLILVIPLLFTGAMELLTFDNDLFYEEEVDISNSPDSDMSGNEESEIETSATLPFLEFSGGDLLPLLIGTIITLPFMPDILGMFLLGLFAGKINLFRRVHELKRKLRITQLILFLVSIPSLVVIVLGYVKAEGAVSSVSLGNDSYVHLSGLTLSIFYIITIALMLEKKVWRKLLNPFRYVGQMALTNYLCQTIFGVILFYGFDLYGRISLTEGLLYSILFYCVQMLFSKLWLKRFRFGPFEWLWRTMTYGKLQSFKITTDK